MINWNGNLLHSAIPKETLNAELEIKQDGKYPNPCTRLSIAGQIVKQKVNSSISLINGLSRFYDIDIDSISKETERLDYANVNSLMMYEGHVASAYWSILSNIFNQLAPVLAFSPEKPLIFL